MENESCLECGKKLTGRWDKKYCDDTCRARHHNTHKRASEKTITAVNRRLRRNRSILKTLSPSCKATVRREVLESLGFSFKYFSSIYQTNSAQYFFCYEYGYRAISEISLNDGKPVQKVVIIQKQEFMTNEFDPWTVSLKSKT
ncbi:MAG: hypothetical protein JXQ90_10815 [Cyclobacteriaceae bacterium]